MLTFVEAISLAGDRNKQNDDALGLAQGRAWVIDGATDLDPTPLTPSASDAAWIAHFANAELHRRADAPLRDVIADTARAARDAFAALTGGPPPAKWRSPIASLLMAEEDADGVHGLDLGDCRAFALDVAGAAFAVGGPPDAVDSETQAAAQQTDSDKPLLQREATLVRLKQAREIVNQLGSQWTFGLDPACADHARAWRFMLARPAHILLMTDGFAALTDRYSAHDAAGLVRASLSVGLQDLGRELRAIEAADAAGARHPRFKRSDDATALLLRLS